MDRFDRAQILEERDRKNAIASRVQYQGTSADDCIDCANPIPQERRDAIPGVQRCTHCQQLNEA
ncbi:MAG: TraR/DksA C4-type zinc finger protein [Candidatus Sedimenticola sp. (ex Thyasira tokunagai)]